MKFIVIGEPCVDLIYKPDNEVTKSYGGILYSVIALSVLARKSDSILPVMNIGEDEYDNIINILKKYPNILLDGITKVQHPTRKVNLFFNYYNSGKKAKMECSNDSSYTIHYDAVEKFLPDADAMLVNMISGVDIDLNSFAQIRKNFKGNIHIDIHNLVMKTNQDGSREHTTLEEWRKWCANTDTIQMNEFEVTSMSRVKKNEYEVIEEILIHQKSDVKGVIITKGKIGVSGYIKKEKFFNGEKYIDLDKHDVVAVENPKFKDTTGCGDVFAASFTMDYSHNKDFTKSLHYATRMDSFKTSFEGIDELYKLK